MGSHIPRLTNALDRIATGLEHATTESPAPLPESTGNAPELDDASEAEPEDDDFDEDATVVESPEIDDGDPADEPEAHEPVIAEDGAEEPEDEAELEAGPVEDEPLDAVPTVIEPEDEGDIEPEGSPEPEEAETSQADTVTPDCAPTAAESPEPEADTGPVEEEAIEPSEDRPPDVEPEVPVDIDGDSDLETESRDLALGDGAEPEAIDMASSVEPETEPECGEEDALPDASNSPVEPTWAEALREIADTVSAIHGRLEVLEQRLASDAAEQTDTTCPWACSTPGKPDPLPMETTDVP